MDTILSFFASFKFKMKYTMIKLLIDNTFDNSLGRPTYIPTTLTKEKILKNHRFLFCIHLEFQPKMKNWIFRHY